MQKITSRGISRKEVKGPICYAGTHKVFERKLADGAKGQVISSRTLESAPKKAIMRLIDELHGSFSNPRVFKRTLIEFGKKYNVEVDDVTIKMVRSRMESLFFSDF